MSSMLRQISPKPSKHTNITGAGGLLVLLELTGSTRWIDLVFGLTRLVAVYGYQSTAAYPYIAAIDRNVA